MREIIIWGGTGHSKTVFDNLGDDRKLVSAVFDNNVNVTESPIRNVPLIHGSQFNEWLSSRDDIKSIGFILAIAGGNGLARKEVGRFLCSQNLTPIDVISEKSIVAHDVISGKGTQLLAGCNVGANAKFGDYCIVNNNANVDHDALIGNYCHIAPGATLTGEIELGENVFIGAGSVILPRIKVGSNVVVGAGSVVTKDIPSDSIVYGNPARIKGEV
uniref:Sugar acetyltransferase n=1 Tax=Pseudoalteromonas rubra TaxID=43658 RepID=A0A0F4QDP1_9GAMM|nr:hypothetical protein TW77_21475 [Pseudoalteromonas rubra]